MRLRASLHCVFSTLMCFLNERCESHHSPRNFVDSSTGKSVFPILTMGGLWARDRGAVKCMTLHLWAANLKPFLVAHSCMAFTACCRCLSMVSRERPRKHIARSSTKSALKMSLAIQEGSPLIFSPKHVLQPLQLWLGAGTSVAPVLVSQDKDICHVQLYFTWFEPTSEWRSSPVVSYLYSGHLPVAL